MPSPKSGTAGNAVSPAAPTAPQPADDANPGQVDQVKAQQIQTQTGKYGSTPTTPYKPPQTDEEKQNKTSWIEIVLVDQDDNPVPGEHYQITLPDNSVADGTLDDKGFARVEGIDSGTCQITFPDLDKDAWDKA
jgi:type VI secretion system secreted protein VgrG